MFYLRLFLSFFLSVFLLVSCSNSKSIFHSDSKLHRFDETLLKKKISRYPELLTTFGFNKDKNIWDDHSQEFLIKNHRFNQRLLKKLLSFKTQSLSKKSYIHWRILKKILENEIEGFEYRFHDYRENQFFGRHSGLNAFLINKHTIRSIQDAKDYISRARGVAQDLKSLQEHLQIAEQKGIIPPRIIFPHIVRSIEKLLTGRPFDNSEADHILVQDFKSKLKSLHLHKRQKRKLVTQLNQALLESYKGAYEKHLEFVKRLSAKASSSKVGAWKHPQGSSYYNFSLRRQTTTNLTPEQIHQLGRKHVQRLHRQAAAIQKKLKFQGSLQQFFNHLRNDPSFYYSRPENYIRDTQKALDKAQKKLSQFFGILPRHSLTVRRVEAFREKSSGSAFYDLPAMDNSRPGIYYINLYDLREQAKYHLEAIAYHEGFPGHHLQISISMDLKDVPQIRRWMPLFTAYTEGWGLYAERLSKEMKLYSTIYDELGQVLMELKRACRLVVDTGLHHKKWTREQAIHYLLNNSEVSYNSAVRSIERYIVMPGQATAYMVGMLKILELRQLAKKELKQQFNIREFHDQILGYGTLPLDLLEEVILNWIEEVKATPSIFG